MDLGIIKAELHRQPFRPFELVLSDGSTMLVPHHDYLTFSPGGATLQVYHSPEGFRHVDTYSVTQVVPVEPASSSGSRRTRKKR